MLWFGVGDAPAIFIIALAAFFPLLLATVAAVRNVPAAYLRVATSFGASPLQSHRLQDDLHRTWKQRRSAVVFVTHDIDEAVYLDERVVLLSPVQGGISGDIPIRIPRPADRTGSHFLGARREVFSAFHLIHEMVLEFAI